MNLLAIEILLAAYALKRGWRVTPLLLLALPFALEASEASLASCGSWLGGMFDPAGTGYALAHAVSVVGLVVTCWSTPAELPSRVLGRPRGRSGPLYQI